MSAAILLLASIYTLPDGKFPEPDKAQLQRIRQALNQIRAGADGADRAVRDLALIGEAALPAIVKRLNKAESGERLLLLASVRRMPRARPLIEQAGKDESAAIRAWIAPPPARDPPDLRRMAARYLDLLALAEEKRRIDVDRDLAGLEPTVGRPLTRFKGVRDRMRDRRLADQIQAERTRAANDFARAGAVALKSGALQPSVSDPVFMAYLSLVEEEGFPPFFAVPALVAIGEKVIPALHWCLARDNHDPRVILRILFSVDPKRSLYARFDTQRADVQRALVTLAPEDRPLLRKAALARDGSVRAAALDALLRLPAPAGADVARTILERPVEYGANEFRRAARLLARASRVELLAEYAVMAIPDDGTERAAQLHKLKQVCASTLRTYGGDAAVPIGERLLKSPAERLLGVDLIRDPKRLVELARTTGDERFQRVLLQRALRVGGAAVAKDVVAILRKRGGRLSLWLHHELRRQGCVKELIGIAALENERSAALGALGQFGSIDKVHEEALLALHEKQPDEKSLRALLALDTPKVQEAFRAAKTEDALDALASRAEMNSRTATRIPLLALVKDADPRRLKFINDAASAMPSVEPGLYYALFTAWDAVTMDPETATEDGPDRQKVDVLKVLARSDDKLSAERLFADLLAGKFKDPPFVLGTLKAAARLVPPARLVALLPLLRKLCADEYPLASAQPRPPDTYRRIMLHGGVTTLGYARAEGALDALCDFVLDSKLHAQAFRFKTWSAVPYWTLDALRGYPAVKVNAAMRKALRRAEAEGRLAGLHPTDLFRMVRFSREWRYRGRGLYEVGLALCEVLERLPWEGEVSYEKMRALGGLRRYKRAAAAARAAAADKRAGRYTPVDGYRTPEFLEGRARLYEGLAAGTLGAFDSDDPFLLNLAAWYALFYAPDAALAERAAEKAVRLSAGLYHPYRDTLAAVRIGQKRAKDALRLLDERIELPVKRPTGSGWYLYFQAQAEMLLGDRRAARQDLEQALEDRRLIPTATRDPVFGKLTELLSRVEEDFLDKLFRWEG